MGRENEILPGYRQDSRGLYNIDQNGNKWRPIICSDDGDLVIQKIINSPRIVREEERKSKFAPGTGYGARGLHYGIVTKRNNYLKYFKGGE